MKKAGSIRKQTTLVLQAVFFLLCTGRLSALDPSRVLPSVSPGTYASAQVITFGIPEGTRLSASFDGASWFDPATPLILSGNPGGERIYAIDTELRSLDPGSPVLERRRFSWFIDLKPPSSPVFSETSVEGGRTVVIGPAGSGTVFYQLYHPFSGTRASAAVEPGSSVFLPEGAVLCAFARDEAGNAGPAASVPHRITETETRPFRVVNPVPGTWANPQVLVVEAPADTDIFYSIDGTDPAVSGLAYSGPASIDVQGTITLRVAAVDASGKQSGIRVVYTVTAGEKPAGLDLPAGATLAETGEFAEIGIPAGYAWSFDDAVPFLEGGRQILFSAVRGSRRYYPLTVSDGTSLWRWVCASGTERTAEQSGPAVQTAAPAATPTPRGPNVRIHDWHFVSIDHDAPVYVSLDGKNWLPYTAPVFADRKSPRELYWYAADWKAGERQTVRLPPKPRITGVNRDEPGGAPVFLSADSGDYAFLYETGSIYHPASPGTGSPLLASGLLTEVPFGASSIFSVRFRAVLDGLDHGEIDTRILIDRKPPRVPSPGIPSELTYSRSPVTFTPSGEERIVLSIEPELFTTDGRTFVLTGNPARPVDYTVKVHAVDGAGNMSAVETRSLTVDLNALYVDASRPAGVRSSGSPDEPFAGLDDALTAVRGTGAWRILVKGSAVLSRSHTVQAHVSITGENALLMCGPDASFVVNGGNLALTDVSFRQNLPEPATGVLFGESVKQDRPLFDIRNGTFTASGVDIVRSGRSSLSLLRASGATLTLSRSRFDLSSAEYALLFDAADSTLSISGCTLLVAARNASALSVSSTKTAVSASTITVSAAAAGRAIEAWNSPLTLKSLMLERRDTAGGNRDTAIWLDKKSTLVSESGVTSTGFWRYKAAEGR